MQSNSLISLLMTTSSGLKSHANGRTIAAQCVMFASLVAFQFALVKVNFPLLVAAI
jgi:hypothetical protein